MVHIKMTLLVLCALLAGCNRPLTNKDIIQHPRLLEKAVEQCQSQQEPPSLDCEAVYQAAEQFSSLMLQHRENTLSFALKIMKVQTHIVELQQKIIDLKKQILSQNDNAQLMDQLKSLRKALQRQQEELNLFYAVVSELRPGS